MSVLRGDCVEVMAGMDEASVDAIVTDPPYGLEFMGKEWDRLWNRDRSDFEVRPNGGFSPFTKARPTYEAGPKAQVWHQQWAAAALRVARPGAYLLAFGGTRTVHRMTCALEDAGWVIRDMLVWAYAQGFPKSRASLKPAWEPIVLARKPGPLRDLNIDAARIGTTNDGAPRSSTPGSGRMRAGGGLLGTGTFARSAPSEPQDPDVGRWPANVILTDPILDGGWEGVVGGGAYDAGPIRGLNDAGSRASGFHMGASTGRTVGGDTGTYSRFFMIPKAGRAERVLSDGRRSPHPTQKPEALIRHLVTLVTPPGGLVLDPFLGSGTLGVVCDGLGMRWAGIEREPEYADWAEARIADRSPEWAVA